MASPIITPIPVQNDTEYRPVSRLAVAGLLLAIPSVLLFTSANLSWVFFLFTLPALCVSVMALRSIQKSNGVFAGEAVARMSIVIAVACGLGWLTYQLVTKYVTELEARNTVEAWLEKMRKGESGAAFLMTTLPKQRAINFNPEEYSKLRKQFPAAQQASLYDNFLADPAYGQILRFGEAAKLEYRGTLDFIERPGSLTYNFRYHLTTPEANGDLIIQIRSEDVQVAEGTRREWILGYNHDASRMRWTTLGDEVQFAVSKANESVDLLMNAIVGDRKADQEAVVAKDPAQRGEFEQVSGDMRTLAQESGGRVGIQKPIRLRSAVKQSGTWLLKLDCTALIEPERIIEFSVYALGDPADRAKYRLQDFKFVGTRRVLAPEDDPTAPQLMRRTAVGQQ